MYDKSTQKSRASSDLLKIVYDHNAHLICMVF